MIKRIVDRIKYTYLKEGCSETGSLYSFRVSHFGIKNEAVPSEQPRSECSFIYRFLKPTK